MMNWGTWVVFPHPVSPATSTTLLPAIASRICCLHMSRKEQRSRLYCLLLPAVPSWVCCLRLRIARQALTLLGAAVLPVCTTGVPGFTSDILLRMDRGPLSLQLACTAQPAARGFVTAT